MVEGMQSKPVSKHSGSARYRFIRKQVILGFEQWIRSLILIGYQGFCSTTKKTFGSVTRAAGSENT